jgi:transposase InsO family protein
MIIGNIPSSMIMTGFAHRPTTEVLPACSKEIILSLIKGNILLFIFLNSSAHFDYWGKGFGKVLFTSAIKEMQNLGVISSYSRPRVSNDNPYSEALFRTCKYCSSYPTEGFESIDAAREWVKGFVEWYNNELECSNESGHTKSQKSFCFLSISI